MKTILSLSKLGFALVCWPIFVLIFSLFQLVEFSTLCNFLFFGEVLLAWLYRIKVSKFDKGQDNVATRADLWLLPLLVAVYAALKYVDFI